MPDSTICTAVKRVESALTQKPGRGPQPDSPAQAVLTAGLGMQVRHPSGKTLRTDMPTSLGGGGEEVAPGWLMRAGLASSKGEARRGIEGKGFSVNDVAETDVQRRLTRADLRQERFVMLRKGKKNHAMLVVER